MQPRRKSKDGTTDQFLNTGLPTALVSQNISLLISPWAMAKQPRTAGTRLPPKSWRNQPPLSHGVTPQQLIDQACRWHFDQSANAHRCSRAADRKVSGNLEHWLDTNVILKKLGRSGIWACWVKYGLGLEVGSGAVDRDHAALGSTAPTKGKYRGYSLGQIGVGWWGVEPPDWYSKRPAHCVPMVPP